VYHGWDIRLGRAVAVKVLKPQSLLGHGSYQERFHAEARTLASLLHPHIVAVHDFIETEEGLTAIIMELAAPRTLEHELASRGVLEPTEMLALLFPLMGALACAHDRGIVHRDIKPANIVVERNSQGVRAKLLDFGIAKTSAGETTSGVAVGTPSYMSPEQAMGENLSPATDVWAMGVLMFRCLSGRLPFEVQSATGVLLKICNERAPLLHTVCPSVSARLASSIDCALEPKRDRRYPGMRELARTLVVACVQDGVAIASDPDPVGLPDFRSWLAATALDQTARMVGPLGRPLEAAPLVTTEPDAQTAVPTQDTARRSRHERATRARTNALVAIVAALSVAALVTFALRARPDAKPSAGSVDADGSRPALEVGESAPPLPTKPNVPKPAESEPPLPALPALPAPLASDAPLPPWPPHQDTQRPSSQRTPRRAKTTVRAAPAPQAVPPASAPSAPPPAKGLILRDWAQ